MSAVFKQKTWKITFVAKNATKWSAIEHLFRGILLPQSYSSFKEHRQESEAEWSHSQALFSTDPQQLYDLGTQRKISWKEYLNSITHFVFWLIAFTDLVMLWYLEIVPIAVFWGKKIIVTANWQTLWLFSLLDLS